jgi:hypothetical protein
MNCTLTKAFTARALALLAVVLVVAMTATSAMATPPSGQANRSNARLCAKNWETRSGPFSTSVLQTETGGSFSSIADCARSHGVFAPSLSIEDETLHATGFHPNESALVLIGGFSQPQEIPYAFNITTDSEGAAVISHGAFGERLGSMCPGNSHFAIVIDAHGVRADITFTPC